MVQARTGAGRGRRRDRRGRGMRGPGVLPTTPGTPATATRAQRFDELVVTMAREVEQRWRDRLGLVEYAVEDAPQIPDDWEPPHAGGSPVPLSSLVRASGSTPARIVLFRRPIEHRCYGHDDLEALVHAVVVEQVAELLGLDPSQVDPRYGTGE